MSLPQGKYSQHKKNAPPSEVKTNKFKQNLAKKQLTEMKDASVFLINNLSFSAN